MDSAQAAEHLEAFVSQHSLRNRAARNAESPAITWARESLLAISHAYCGLSETVLASLPASGLILHLLQRAESQVEAAIVAFVTGSSPASEALSCGALILDAELKTDLKVAKENPSIPGVACLKETSISTVLLFGLQHRFPCEKKSP